MITEKQKEIILRTARKSKPEYGKIKNDAKLMQRLSKDENIDWDEIDGVDIGQILRRLGRESKFTLRTRLNYKSNKKIKILNLTGKKVNHKKFGNGIVTKVSNTICTVNFGSYSKLIREDYLEVI